jgi:hypothetical protein
MLRGKIIFVFSRIKWERKKIRKVDKSNLREENTG